jgi:hypothetical protein
VIDRLTVPKTQECADGLAATERTLVAMFQEMFAYDMGYGWDTLATYLVTEMATGPVN